MGDYRREVGRVFVARIRRGRIYNINAPRRPHPYDGSVGSIFLFDELDEDTELYFQQIQKINIHGYKTEKEKELFANNVLSQAKHKELPLACHRRLSKVLDDLLPFASDIIIKNFISALDDVRVHCTSRASSFTLQTLIKVCSKRVRENPTGENSEIFSEFIVKTSRFIFKCMEIIITRQCANQLGRTCLEECSGYGNRTPLAPDDVEKLATRMMTWKNFNELTNDVTVSAFLQTLLRCLNHINKKLAQKFIKFLLEECYKPQDPEDEKQRAQLIDDVFASVPYTRLLEVMIEEANGKRYTQILVKIFINRLKILACSKSSSIAVRKLIAKCPEKTELNIIMVEIAPSFGEHLVDGYVEVLVELAKACVRLNAFEGDFLKALRYALNIGSGGDNFSHQLVERLLCPSGYSVAKSGSLLLQTLFTFRKPIIIAESLLAINTEKLVTILMDARGSYIADAFVSSETIGAKSRERLVSKLKGYYKHLAQDKSGSRVIEALMSKAKIKEKHIILGDLDRTIMVTQPGSIIASKFHLELYLQDKSKWAQVVEAKTVEEKFSDIIK